MTDFDRQFRRTLNIIKLLSEGKVLYFDNGYKIAMGDDMSIGYVVQYKSSGEYAISGMATLDLKQLNDILNKNDVFEIID